jgi:hypothetical protein
MFEIYSSDHLLAASSLFFTTLKIRKDHFGLGTFIASNGAG